MIVKEREREFVCVAVCVCIPPKQLLFNMIFVMKNRSVFMSAVEMQKKAVIFHVINVL